MKKNKNLEEKTSLYPERYMGPTFKEEVYSVLSTDGNSDGELPAYQLFHESKEELSDDDRQFVGIYTLTAIKRVRFTPAKIKLI